MYNTIIGRAFPYHAKIFVNARVRIGNHRRVAVFFVKCNRADAADDSVTVAVLPHGGQAAQQQRGSHAVSLLAVQNACRAEKSGAVAS